MLSHGTGATVKGRERFNNEDVFYVNDELGLYLVCDGAGGNAAGEVAAAMAVRAVVNTCEEDQSLIMRVRNGLEPHQALGALARRAVGRAAFDVYQMSQTSLIYSGMGTTLTLLIVAGDKAVVAHVGDSRAYISREGSVCQLTTDHTVSAMLVQYGDISPEQEAHHELRNYLTRSIGMRPPVDVQIIPFEVRPGDSLLLCSDGLSDCLEGANALRPYLEGKTDGIPTNLLRLAKRFGGADDITAIAINIEEESRQLATQRVRPTRGRRLFRHWHWAAHTG